jgi:hypothetical protein
MAVLSCSARQAVLVPTEAVVAQSRCPDWLLQTKIEVGNRGLVKMLEKNLAAIPGSNKGGKVISPGRYLARQQQERF